MRFEYFPVDKVPTVVWWSTNSHTSYNSKDYERKQNDGDIGLYNTKYAGESDFTSIFNNKLVHIIILCVLINKNISFLSHIYIYFKF